MLGNVIGFINSNLIFWVLAKKKKKINLIFWEDSALPVAETLKIGSISQEF
jgi:hypothetical protein